MAVKARDIIKKLPKERQAHIRGRTDALIAEEMTLRDVRKALQLTQDAMAERLEIGQDSVSRIEKRSDLLLSTIAQYIEAMGGTLKLVAEFPDRPPVTLTGFAELDERATSRGKARA